MSSCKIHLDNFQEQYYPGANIQGRVICSFTGSENIREIRLNLKGEEHTSWTESESYYDSTAKRTKTRRVRYTGDHTFLRLSASLVGSGEIGPGRFEYPFSFILPKKLPSSYNGTYGWIHYSIKATVDKPFAFDYEDVVPFKVVALIDLNTMIDQLVLHPVCYSDDKMICCWCCASGPITMNVHLEKEAFVPGEAAKVKVEITNLSNESLESLEVKMGMTVESKVTSPKTKHKHDYELLATHRDSGVGAHGERLYEFELEIPQSTPVPNFELSKLFDQWTNIAIEAVIPGCHRNFTITSKVVMGNIPVRGQGQIQNMSNQHNASLHPFQQNNQFPTGEAQYLGPAPPYEAASNYPPPFPTNDSAGPSAPPPENIASAPPKAELAVEEDFSMVNIPNSSSGGATDELLPPPSYNTAVSLPPYLPK